MGDEEGGLDGALVGVVTLVENQLVQVHVVVINGVIEGKCDHLGHLGGLEVVGNLGSKVMLVRQLCSEECTRNREISNIMHPLFVHGETKIPLRF